MKDPKLAKPAANRKLDSNFMSPGRWKVCVTTLFLGLMAGASCNAAEARTFYVSNVTAPPNPDGASWTTAWTGIDKINWSVIAPGDTIEIDGGNGTYFNNRYSGTLTVGKSGQPGLPITIKASESPGRNGQVEIEGNYADQTNGVKKSGIVIGDNSYIVVKGRPMFNRLWTKSLKVVQFAGDGIVTGPNSHHVVLENLHVRAAGVSGRSTYTITGAGVKLQGSDQVCDGLLLDDNGLNLDVYSSNQNAPSIKNCVIRNYTLMAYKADGIRINNTYRQGYGHFYLNNCILGPGLSTGVIYSQENSGLSVYNSLFVNPRITNIRKTTVSSFYSGTMSLRYVTSFVTPLNDLGQGHSCLTYKQEQDSVWNSIFYGGNVEVVGSGGTYINNVQFKTSGNTLLLSPSQTDPLFQTNPNTLSNDVYKLLYANFRLRSDSPAAGKGCDFSKLPPLL
ncbi:MAG: hypothetical protein K2Z81_12950 [Cyanobacteria bacterium]|nr:hypothetical protein [Cyanobacteriota bacterium]